jgi:putative tricarboxylic transport membrane protein
MIENILEGLNLVFRLDSMLLAFAGVTLGMIMGAIPGFSDITAITLLLPITYYLEPVAGIAMLVGMSKGCNFGGSVPAILLNMPGASQAVVTAIDGYPLSQKGQSGKALKTALYASTMADTMSDFVLFFLAAPVAAIAIKIGPPEYAMIVFFSLVVIGLVGSDKLFKGMIALGIGLFLSTIGTDPVMGKDRFTFGWIQLEGGVAIVPLALGLFVVSEAFRQVQRDLSETQKQNKTKKTTTEIDVNKSVGTSNKDDQRVTKEDFKKILPSIFTGFGIGSIIGAIPGIGSGVAAYLSYMRAKRASKHPELFGKGALEGIAAAEAGNNAVVGPNLIPLITLGIPGNLVAALVLGAFMLKGLTPGPLFMRSHAPMLYALFIVLIISNLFTFTVGNFVIRLARYISKVPIRILHPIVIVFAAIGCYFYRNNYYDILFMLPFAFLGIIFARLEIPNAVILIAYILGTMFEERARQALSMSGGDVLIFLTRPISLVFFICSILVAVLLIRSKFKKRQSLG